RARMATLAANAEHHVECPECTTILDVPFLPPQAHLDDIVTAEESAVEFHNRETNNDGELDMTPMVDVTFLLLIFFMVTAAFTMQKSFQLPTPNQDAPSSNYRESVEEDGVITVRIDEYNTFHVSAPGWDEEQEAPSEQELLRRLREARQGDGRGNVPNTLIVEANGDATHEKVVMALDAGSEIGMEEVKLRTVDEE
ncbi:MAG: biopolymer transporter ExbD, partial [Planctomycetales bacterium]|nr:biopolymer transporter ExbD [Planctomycetales bacterium]